MSQIRDGMVLCHVVLVVVGHLPMWHSLVSRYGICWSEEKGILSPFLHDRIKYGRNENQSYGNVANIPSIV